MYAVETYAAVRQFVFVEGRSRREAASVFGLNRDTISKMCRFSAPPGYVRSKPPGKPKLGPLIPIIDAILAADVTAPPKQRHTAQRVFERLKTEHGFSGGYTVVKDYVRIAKGRSRETFVPLAHPPGHAQVDFGEAIGVIGGVRQKIHVFFMDIPHSDAPFMKAYPAFPYAGGRLAARSGYSSCWSLLMQQEIGLGSCLEPTFPGGIRSLPRRAGNGARRRSRRSSQRLNGRA
jgi:hypothetical protein